MKAFILISSFIGMIFTSQASELGIKMKDGSYFLFQLDNSFFNKPETVYNLINVAEGYHYIQVYRVSDYGDTKLAFKGYIYIPGNSQVKAIVEPDHRIKVSTEYVQTNPVPVPVSPGTLNPPTSSSSSATPAPVVLSDQELKDIINAVDKVSFSSTKLSTAKNSLSGKQVKSSQVAALVKLFVFESDKIDLAKYCYDITLDKSNYYLVNDSFSFSSSIDEMNKFLKSKQ